MFEKARSVIQEHRKISVAHALDQFSCVESGGFDFYDWKELLNDTAMEIRGLEISCRNSLDDLRYLRGAQNIVEIDQFFNDRPVGTWLNVGAGRKEGDA